MTLFRLDASIREEGSHSRQIADIVQREWDATHPGQPVVNREIGIDPLPSDAWAASLSGQRDAVELAATLVDELAAADAMILAVPLYNFGVSQHFKTWVDLAVTDPRMAPGVTPATAGIPAVLATVHGGYYAAGTPREGWDHATPWMRRILQDVWQLDLLVVEADFTLVGTNPALDEFGDLARELRAAADQRAREHGRTLASRVNRELALPSRA
jgi:FMN-dependent NADH-azoreductase